MPVTFVFVELYLTKARRQFWFFYLHCKVDATLTYAGREKGVGVSQVENP